MLKKLANEEINWLLLSEKENYEKNIKIIAQKNKIGDGEITEELKTTTELLDIGERIENKIIITPELFKNVFLLALTDFESKLVKYWDTPGEFTKIMIGKTLSDKSMLHLMADILKLKYYREYWSLDAVFYEKEDKEHFQLPFLVAEYLPVVIEHENAISGSCLEMNKLSIFNSPLKVLITYPETEDKNKYLNWYTEILKKADIFDDFSTKRKHLLIFGYKKEEKTFWEFYTYQNKTFSLLE
ncbi:MAG TPA: hypothetical protein P5150_06965 [Candidatus Ratteibacteria bacterium]|nr:hypothetical protein [Candidatus Ratteibacteria bacterium]